MSAIRFKDGIFGSFVILVGLGLIAVGIDLLVNIGDGVGFLGIFVASFGGFVIWSGQSIIRNKL